MSTSASAADELTPVQATPALKSGQIDESSLAMFSPLSLTSPLQANNLLESRYNGESNAAQQGNSTKPLDGTPAFPGKPPPAGRIDMTTELTTPSTLGLVSHTAVSQSANLNISLQTGANLNLSLPTGPAVSAICSGPVSYSSANSFMASSATLVCMIRFVITIGVCNSGQSAPEKRDIDCIIGWMQMTGLMGRMWMWITREWSFSTNYFWDKILFALTCLLILACLLVDLSIERTILQWPLNYSSIDLNQLKMHSDSSSARVCAWLFSCMVLSRLQWYFLLKHEKPV